MKIKHLLPPLVLFLLASPCFAELFIAPNQGQIDRASNEAFSMSGTFRFFDAQNDIRGIIVARTNGFDGSFTFCDFYDNPCSAGQTIRLLDTYTGTDGLRQGPDPITVIGTPFNTIFYRSSLVFDGGAVRLPYHLTKRQTFRITAKTTVSGDIKGYTNSSLVTPLFTASLNLQGTVTVVFTRKAGSFPAAYYVSRITHNFAPSGS